MQFFDYEKRGEHPISDVGIGSPVGTGKHVLHHFLTGPQTVESFASGKALLNKVWVNPTLKILRQIAASLAFWYAKCMVAGSCETWCDAT